MTEGEGRVHQQCLQRESELRKEKHVLLQRIELLEAEIKDYQEKQCRDRKLNDSIMIGLRHTENIRDQSSQKEITHLLNKHAEEIKRIKQKSNQDQHKLEESLAQYRINNEKLKIDAEKNMLQQEKQISELKTYYHDWIQDKEKDIQTIYDQKLQNLHQKLKSSEKMANIYKDLLEERRIVSQQALNFKQLPFSSNLEPENIENKKFPSNFKQSEVKIQHSRDSRDSVLHLTTRINRALSQLKPNSQIIKNKINKINSKQNNFF